MTLVVPVLRLFMLALNIYDTYKVLKPPKASTRNRDGRPADRALSQRKRQMKGCLAVWIVWCCYVTYERTAESILALFVPFYDSCKSLVLLFLILTRARGAEPIFLHVIRPLLRPYTATLDAVADVGRSFGDLIFLLLAYPFRVVAEWWNTYWTLVEEPPEDIRPTRLSHPLSLQPGGGRRRSAGAQRDDGHLNVAATVAAYADSALYQVWHPPRSAYEDDDDPPPPMPVPQLPVESPEAQLARKEMEEWRQYPPLPSAYPPTPLPVRLAVHPDPEPLPVISEEARRQMDEWRKYPPFPSAYPATPLTRPTSISASHNPPVQFAPILEEDDDDEGPQLGFGQSLPSPPELSNPGSVRGVSDARNALGIYEAMDEDEDEDEDDEFDVTLRTPEPMTRSRTKQSLMPPIPLSRLSSVSAATDDSLSSVAGRKRSRDLVSPTGSGEESGSGDLDAVDRPLALTELSTSESDMDGSGVEEAEAEAEAESVSEAELELELEPVSVPVIARGSRTGNSKRRKVVGAGELTPRRVQPRRGSREPQTTTTVVQAEGPQARRAKRDMAVAPNPNPSRVSSRTSSSSSTAADPPRPSRTRRGTNK
ncbi:hypothetical protein C8F01DRAFT_1119506 [Mycena amicta]|nr:hypothetical protein C8F01DRAFT_1119506 [Mycena amicta]